MTMTYCWRYGRVVPMLDESEWEQIEPLLYGNMRGFARLVESGHSSEEATRLMFQPIKEKFAEIVGVEDGPTIVNAVWLHRRSQYGPDCPSCTRPFRTGKASFCAECGFQREDVGQHLTDED